MGAVHHPEKGTLGTQGLQGQTLIRSGGMTASQKIPAWRPKKLGALASASQLPVTRQQPPAKTAGSLRLS